MLQILKWKALQPAGRLPSQVRQLAERRKQGGRAGLVHIHAARIEHQGEEPAGHRPLRPGQATAVGRAGPAAPGVHIGRVRVEQIKILGHTGPQLPRQKGHGKGLVRILRTAAVAAVLTVAVLQPAVVPAQFSAPGKALPPLFQIVPKPRFHPAFLNLAPPFAGGFSK